MNLLHNCVCIEGQKPEVASRADLRRFSGVSGAKTTCFRQFHRIRVRFGIRVSFSNSKIKYGDIGEFGGSTMANIVRIGSKSPKILVSKMVWLGVRNGAKMVKIGGKWGEKSKIFQAVPGSKMVDFTPLGLFKAVFMGFRAFSRAKNTKKRSLAPLARSPRINFFLNI